MEELSRPPTNGMSAADRAAAHLAPRRACGTRSATSRAPARRPPTRSTLAATGRGRRAAGRRACCCRAAAAVFPGDLDAAVAPLAVAEPAPRRPATTSRWPRRGSPRASCVFRPVTWPRARRSWPRPKHIARRAGLPFTLAVVLNMQAKVAELTGEDDVALDKLDRGRRAGRRGRHDVDAGLHAAGAGRAGRPARSARAGRGAVRGRGGDGRGVVGGGVLPAQPGGRRALAGRGPSGARTRGLGRGPGRRARPAAASPWPTWPRQIRASAPRDVAPVLPGEDGPQQEPDRRRHEGEHQRPLLRRGLLQHRAEHERQLRPARPSPSRARRGSFHSSWVTQRAAIGRMCCSSSSRCSSRATRSASKVDGHLLADGGAGLGLPAGQGRAELGRSAPRPGGAGPPSDGSARRRGASRSSSFGHSSASSPVWCRCRPPSTSRACAATTAARAVSPGATCRTSGGSGRTRGGRRGARHHVVDVGELLGCGVGGVGHVQSLASAGPATATRPPHWPHSGVRRDAHAEPAYGSGRWGWSISYDSRTLVGKQRGQRRYRRDTRGGRQHA